MAENDNQPKKETVRITLPPRSGLGETLVGAPVKKETVRINLPSRPSLGSASSVSLDASKKESAKLSNLAKPPVLAPRPMTPPPPGGAGAPAPLRPGGPPAPPRPAGAGPGTAAPIAPRPAGLVPAGGPPRPPTAPALPRPPGVPAAPGAGITRAMPPRPSEGVSARPAAVPVPVVPVPSSSVETVTPEIVPSTPARKATEEESSAATVMAPTVKKDTVRIEVPKAKPLPPGATVRIQQTQPMIRPPAAEVHTLAVPGAVAGESADDPTLMYVSIGLLVFSALVLLFQVLNYIALSSA